MATVVSVFISTETQQSNEYGHVHCVEVDGLRRLEIPCEDTLFSELFGSHDRRAVACFLAPGFWMEHAVLFPAHRSAVNPYEKRTLFPIYHRVSRIVVVLICVRAIPTFWIVFDSVSWALTTPHEVESFFLGKVQSDPGWLFYPFVLTLKSTPLMLPLALIGCLLLWKHRKHPDETSRHFRMAVALVAGVLLFTFCLSATSKKFSRYLLPAFALLEILAAIGIVEGLKWCYTALTSRFGRPSVAKQRSKLAVLACAVFFLIEVVPVLALHPYYGTYYNLCWKATDITKIITVGEGSGLDIAAHYLNEKPDAEKMIVQVSPLATEFVSHYFWGIAYRADRGIENAADYEVVYIRDSQIGRVPQTGTLNGELEAVITLNGIDHVWIYRIQKP